MKVQLLARPDHSLYLYNYLKNLIDIRLLTFNVAHKDSWLHKLHPSAKLVDKETIILYDLIFFAKLSFALGKKGLINPYTWEGKYAEFAYKRKAVGLPADLIHYWPIYCHQYVKKQRARKNVATIADVYCAHPYHILELLQPEYEKYNQDIKTSYFYVDADRNINFLEHEQHIVTNSGYVKNSFLKYAPDKKIFIADYGFLGDAASVSSYEQALALRQQQNSAILKLVYVGTVSIEKGVPYLLDAVKGMNSPNIQLDIIGPIRQGQEHIFKPYAAVNNIKFLGSRPNAEIKKLLAQYSLLVLPSFSDAYSLAVVEALQNGLPVIVSENTGNKDAVMKYQVGEIVKVADSGSIQQAIEKMLDVSYRHHLSENIKTFMNEDLQYPYPLKVLDIYKSLISHQTL